MATTFTYAVKFVGDMRAAIRFHTEQLGFKLRFESPDWSELDTGATTVALHKASPENPAGTCQLGFRVDDIDAFVEACRMNGVKVVEEPKPIHGQRIAELADPDGAVFSASGR